MTVFQLVGLIASLAIVTLLAVIGADFPGRVRIDLSEGLGYEIHLSLGFAFLLVLIFSVLLGLLFGLVRLILAAPQRRAAHRGIAAGKRAVDGLVALAAGDAGETRRIAGELESSIGAMSLFLQARAAQLEGADAQALSFYRKLSEEKRAGLLGLRGQMMLALRTGDDAQSKEVLDAIEHHNLRAPWSIEIRFSLALRRRDWAEAGRALQRAGKMGLLAKDELALKQSILALIEAPDLDVRRRCTVLETVWRRAPTWWRTAHALAVALLEAKENARARRLIETVWRKAPRHEFVPLWLLANEITEAKKMPTRALEEVNQLASFHPGHFESHLAVASITLAGHFLGEARAALGKVREEDRDNQLYCALMAELESLSGNVNASGDWKLRAGEYGGEVVWYCGSCGVHDEMWQGLCPSCGAFDAFFSDRNGKIEV